MKDKLRKMRKHGNRVAMEIMTKPMTQPEVEEELYEYGKDFARTMLTGALGKCDNYDGDGDYGSFCDAQIQEVIDELGEVVEEKSDEDSHTTFSAD